MKNTYLCQICLSIFISCSSDNISSTELHKELYKLDEGITQENLSSVKVATEIINVCYFNKINDIKKDLGKSTRLALTDKIEEKISLSREAETILKGYFNSLNNDTAIGSMVITLYITNARI